MKLIWLPILMALTTPNLFAADFPQCNKGEYTTDTAKVREMMSSVLGIRSMNMLEDEPYSGVRAKVSLVNSAGTILFRSSSMIDITAPAKVCQNKKTLIAVLDSSRAQASFIVKSRMQPSYTLTLSGVDNNTIRITEANKLFNNTFTAQ